MDEPPNQNRTALAVAIERDLTRILTDGWYRFKARNTPTLLLLARHREAATDEERIQDLLCDLLDPPQEDGTRPALDGRARDDPGLVGLWLFGQPEVVNIEKPLSGGHTRFNPSARHAKERYDDIGAAVYGLGTGGYMRRASGRRQGLGWDLRDDLVSQLADLEEARAPSDGASPQAQPATRSVRKSLGWLSFGLLLTALVIFVIGQTTSIISADRDRGHAPESSTSPTNGPSTSGTAPVATEPPGGEPVTPTDELSVKPNLPLAVGLKIANRSYDNEWSSSEIRADPTDELRLALTVKNPSGLDPTRMTAFVQEEQISDDRSISPRRVRLVIGDDSGATLGRTNWVAALPWSDQGTNLVISAFQDVEVAAIQEPDHIVARRRYNNAVTLPFELRDALDPPSWATLGPIPQDEQLYYLSGSWPLRDRAGIGRYPPRFRVLEPTESGWLNTGSVQVGDLIEINILLDDQGNHTGNASISLRPKKKQGGRVIKLVATGQMFDRRERIGAITLSSRTGQPFSILPRPDTTILRAPIPNEVYDCDPERPERKLEDGIMLGGVDIGSFGGFTAQTDCNRVEYNGMISLKANIGP